MARSKTIRDDIKPWIDQLIDLYELTDPNGGEETEIGKLEDVSVALDIWWKLFAELMGWALAQLVGYAIMTNNPDFIQFVEEKMGKEIFADSHELEYLGWTYCFNRYGEENSDQNWMDDFIEGLEESNVHVEPLNYEAMRTLIAEILMSRSTGNSFWRMPFQHSMFALNYGEVDELSTPAKKRRQGKPYQLIQWKLQALSQVYYQVGKGRKKYRALESVAQALGQSTETLRSWEKQLFTERDFIVRLECAQLAGELRGDLQDRRWDEKVLGNPYYYGSDRGVLYTDIARMMLPTLEKSELSKVKSKLRKYRQK